jgi:hypothetical protein
MDIHFFARNHICYFKQDGRRKTEVRCRQFQFHNEYLVDLPFYLHHNNHTYLLFLQFKLYCTNHLNPGMKYNCSGYGLSTVVYGLIEQVANQRIISLLFNRSSRIPEYCFTVFDIGDHDRTGTDSGIFTNCDSGNQSDSGSNKGAFFDRHA